MTTSYNPRTIPTASIYNNNKRISAYYLIDEEGNYLIDEEDNYIIIIGEGSDGLPVNDFIGRTPVNPASYTNRPNI